MLNLVLPSDKVVVPSGVTEADIGIAGERIADEVRAGRAL